MTSTPAELEIRLLESPDLPRVGEILYYAFNRVFSEHGHPPPVPSVASGESLARAYAEYEPEASWVALLDQTIVASAFTHPRGLTAGIGPVTVDPEHQSRGIGKRLMRFVLDRLQAQTSIRLFQDAFNRQSFALYSGLGFEGRDIMAVLRAAPTRFRGTHAAGRLRELHTADLNEVAMLDFRLTGLDRPADLVFLVDRGPAFVLEGSRGIEGYGLAFKAEDTLFLGPVAATTTEGVLQLSAHICGEADCDIVTVRAFGRPGTLMTALLAAGFEVRSLGTYMVRGSYEEPRGVQLSALFPEAL